MTRAFPWWSAIALAFACGASFAFEVEAQDSPVTEEAEEERDDDTASGQPDTTPRDPNTVYQPRLLTLVDAGYPAEALASGLEPAIEMMLTIGTDGFVENAELIGEPVGQGFDELALAAARRFLFEPASKGDVPMRARVRFRYQFKLPAPAPVAGPVEEAPRPGKLEFTILAAESSIGVAEAEVLVSKTSEPNDVKRFVTDAAGYVEVPDLEPGFYEVSVSRKGMQTEVHQEEVRPGEALGLTYRMSEAKNYEEFGATARVKAPPREVTRRTIEKEELTRVAGTRGDALRTIELLPGVSRPPFSAGLVLIRGSAPGDSQVFLDGVPVPILYHFGGLTSFINSRALEKIDFYPGNFSARYGRHTGGIIDVGARDPATNGYHGVLDMNLPLDSSLLIEGPITKKASFLVAGRRSYFGEVLTATIPKGTFDAFAAPVYYDYQTFVTWRPTDKDKLRFGVYGSSDRLKVLFSNAPDNDPTIRGIEAGLQFHRQQIGWTRQYNPKLEHNMQVSFGRTDQDFSVGGVASFNLKVNELYARAEWKYRLNERVAITTGTDSAFDFVDVKYQGPPPPQGEGNQNQSPPGQLPKVDIHDTDPRLHPSLYTELQLLPIDKLRVVPGLRLDYFSELHHYAFDPRVAVLYTVNDQWRIKGGVGVFSQPPEPQESSKTIIGNPNLIPIKSVHYSLGVDHQFTEDLSLGVEGFYKQLYDRVVSPSTSGAVAGQPPFINDGIGRIYGLEVAGRKNAKGRWFGFLSYTLMRSERKDGTQPWRLFDFDQTHIFTTAATVRVGHGWELGGTLRIITGNPQTPIVNGSLDADVGTYTPVIGRPNSTRAPTFNRLDVRAERKWTFKTWKLAWYLDIQNVYNAKNREGTQYNFNYRESGVIRGLPIIPIMGLRGEL